MFFMDNFNKTFKFIKHSIWKDDTDDKTIFAVGEKYFQNLKIDCSKGKRLFWLTGQSGTGKTSQLLKATQNYCNKQNIRPLHLAVRNFAHLHPLASKLAQDKDFREKTNGFALKVLFYVLKRSLECGLDIILEISFLKLCFENYVLKTAKKQNYKISLQIMSVNILISKALVLKRAKLTGRNTNDSSEKYFYKHMAKGVKCIAKKYCVHCTIWSINKLAPIFIGKSKFAYKHFKRSRKNIEVVDFDEKRFLEAKKMILEVVYQDVFS